MCSDGKRTAIGHGLGAVKAEAGPRHRAVPCCQLAGVRRGRAQSNDAERATE